MDANEVPLQRYIAFYLRVSSDEQAERGTIQNQETFIRKYCDLHGIDNFKLYIDDGYSGTIPLENRPGAAKLLSDTIAGKISAICVYRLDRLARSVKIVLDTYEFFEKHQVALKSLTESFDTGTPTGKFFMTMLASIAALERDTILERTMMGKDRAAREGRWPAGAPPYGYRIGDTGKLKIYEPEAEIIRLIFRLYMEGMSTVPIAEYLNARDIPTPARSKGTNNKSTGKWHAGHISIILRNKVYIGEYEYKKRSKTKKELIPIATPVLISSEEYLIVQEKLIERSDVARGSRKRNYLLRGLIYCGHCGGAYVGSSGDSKAGRVYYRCVNSVNNGSGKKCNAKLIRAELVEDAVWKDSVEFVKHPGKVIKEIEKQAKMVKKTLIPVDIEFANIEKALAEKKASRAKVLSMCTRGLITDQETEQELTTLAKEMEVLEDRRNQLFQTKQDNLAAETQALDAAVLLEELARGIETVNDDLKKDLVQSLVNKIEVFTEYDENGKKFTRARIKYRFTPEQELSGSNNFRKC